MLRALLIGALLLAAQAAGAQIPGQQAGDVSSQADAAAVIGRIVDGQTGTPLARVRVRLHGPGGLQQTVLTDESGIFAFTALPTGLYSLDANKPTYLPGRYPESAQTLRGAGKRFFPLLERQVLTGSMRLFHGGAISGRVLDSHGEPVEFANVQAIRMSRSATSRATTRTGGLTNDLGEFRVARLEPGNYLLIAQPRRDVQEDGVSTQYVPTFYPGALSRDQALAITVERGGSVSEINLTLIDGTMSRVTGTLIDSATGRPAINGVVNVRAVVAGMAEAFDVASAPAKPDGTFELKLAPGEYTIEGRATRPGTVGPLQPEDEQFGTARVTVSGGPESSDVPIVLGRGATVAGRIVFEGKTPAPPTASNSAPLRVSFTSPDGGTGCRMGRSEVGANWTFLVDGLLGTCVAQVQSSLGLLTAKAVVADDIDLMDQAVTFRPGQQLRSVEVIVTDKQTDLTLHVTDTAGQPTSEYAAVVFPIDKARWFENSRYIRAFVPAPPLTHVLEEADTATPGVALPTAARESIKGLPAGEYYVVALEDLEVEAVHDAAVLDALARVATRLTITERAPAEVSLRLVK